MRFSYTPMIQPQPRTLRRTQRLQACWGIVLLIGTLLIFQGVAMAEQWQAWGDEAVSLTQSDVACLEAQSPKSLETLYKLTIHYYRHYDDDRLNRLYADHVNDSPDASALRVIEAIVLMRAHRLDESRAILQDVLKTHPDFHPAEVVLAHLLYLQKDFQASYALARKLAASRDRLSEYHFVVSQLLIAGAKGSLAKKNLLIAMPAYFEVTGALKKAHRLMPEAPEVLYGMGSFYLLTPAVAGGNLDKAIDLLHRATDLTPDNAHAYVRLAQAMKAKGDESAYKDFIEQARRLDPEDELLLDYLSGEKAFLDVP